MNEQAASTATTRRRALHAPCACAWPAQSRSHLAQSCGRRGDREGRGYHCARLDARRAAGRMPKSRPCGGQKKRRRARRCMSRLSRARIRARRRPVQMRLSAPGSHASSPRWRIPIRKWRGRDTNGCAQRASPSRSGLAPKRRDAFMPATSCASRKGRPHVTLKLAISADGKAGLAGRRPGADHRRGCARARLPNSSGKRRHSRRHRHGSVRRSAIDLPSAGHVRALAGAGCAR